MDDTVCRVPMRDRNRKMLLAHTWTTKVCRVPMRDRNRDRRAEHRPVPGPFVEYL